jgi:hypothetical protein
VNACELAVAKVKAMAIIGVDLARTGLAALRKTRSVNGPLGTSVVLCVSGAMGRMLPPRT